MPAEDSKAVGANAMATAASAATAAAVATPLPRWFSNWSRHQGQRRTRKGGKEGARARRSCYSSKGTGGLGWRWRWQQTGAVALVLAPNEGWGRGLGERGGDSGDGGGSSGGGRGVSVDSLQILCRHLRCGVEIKVIVLTREAYTYFACPSARD